MATAIATAKASAMTAGEFYVMLVLNVKYFVIPPSQSRSQSQSSLGSWQFDEWRKIEKCK